MPQKTEQPMTDKEKRVMEAHRLRYMEDKSNKEIAEVLGLNKQTVDRYFSDADNTKFKRFYSDRERFQLEQSLQQDLKDGEDLANNLLARAIQHNDADDKTYLRASEKALKLRERKIKLLQELGVIEKPDTEESDDDGSFDSVNINMEWVETDTQQKEEEVEAEA